jgi:hypothetical protein
MTATSARQSSVLGGLSSFAWAAAAAITLLAVGRGALVENRAAASGMARVDAHRSHVTRVAVDTNFDGRSDVQEYYVGGALVRRESDRDFDDRIDLVQEFDAATLDLVRSVSDVDFDGVADLLELFDGGRPAYSRWRHDAHSPAADSQPNAATAGRIEDGRLKTFIDPFEADLAVRAVSLTPQARDDLGTVAKIGLFPKITSSVRPPASICDLPGSQLSSSSSRSIEPYSPRGPPFSVLLS